MVPATSSAGDGEMWEGSSVYGPNHSLSVTGCFLTFLALPVLILGTGWLLYFVPFGWVLALSTAVVCLRPVPVERESFC